MKPLPPLNQIGTSKKMSLTWVLCWTLVAFEWRRLFRLEEYSDKFWVVTLFFGGLSIAVVYQFIAFINYRINRRG